MIAHMIELTIIFTSRLSDIGNRATGTRLLTLEESSSTSSAIR
jgi:hypothetical protein